MENENENEKQNQIDEQNQFEEQNQFNGLNEFEEQNQTEGQNSFEQEIVNEEQNSFEQETVNEGQNPKKKRVIKIPAIILICILIAIVGVLAGKIIYNNKNGNKRPNASDSRNIDSLSKIEKKIAGVETDKEKKKNEKKSYSELYKDYLKLSEEQKKKSEVIPRKKKVPIKKLDEIKEDLDKDDTKVPSKYNLADKIKIKVENQGSYGLCWDFASIKPLETHLALKNLGKYDFSELHLDYITSDLLFGSRELHWGGNFSEFKEYIIESGVVLEKEVPYEHADYSEEEYMKFNNIKKAVEVTETVEFPTIYKNSPDKYTKKELSKFRDTVKKHIMQNGGLYTAIVGTGDKNHYTDCESEEWADHAVTIVGWDDNYSKDNFKSSNGKTPKNDGAYIALNSWGTFWNDKGYYYISYEDKYVESDLSGIVSTSMDNAIKIDKIKNPEIKKALKEQYGHLFINYKGDDYITKTVVSKINELDLSNKGITSIEGIEILTDLYTLNLSNNDIKDLTPLKSLKSLGSLNISNNKITDISALKDTSLYYINLSGNDIKDVSVLNEIKYEEEYQGLDLNISNIKGVKGYEKITKLQELDISNCGITDVSNLKNLERLFSLNVSNSPGVKGIEELPENVYDLYLSNCDLKEFPKIKDYTNFIDVSDNQITDWSALKEIKENVSINEEEFKEEFEEEFEEEYEDEGRIISINANNCDIDDITILNDLSVPSYLELQNNKIKDLSQLNYDKIWYIDLSGNKDLTGLEKLKNIDTVILNNCNFTDLTEIKKLENVYQLSLEDNNLKDITEISELKNLSSLSLKGNKELTGVITSESLCVLNISECNIDNSFDVSHIEYIDLINISKNNISDINEFVKNANIVNWGTVVIDKINYTDYKELIETYNNEDSDIYLFIEPEEIICDYDGENIDSIDLNKVKSIYKVIMKNYTDGILVKNGYLNKNVISINDKSLGYVKVKTQNYFNYINPTIVFKFNTDTQEEEENNVEEENEVLNEEENEEIVNEENVENEENTDQENINNENQENNNVVNEVNNTLDNNDNSNNDTFNNDIP